MRKFQLTLLCFICLANSYGQARVNNYVRVDVEIIKQKHPKRVSINVNTKSTFPLDSSLLRYIENNLRSIRVDKRVKKGSYLVSAQCIIAKDSTISDVRPLTTVGFGLEAEVVRVLKKAPIWRPAEYRGIPVKPYRTSAITYPDSK